MEVPALPRLALHVWTGTERTGVKGIPSIVLIVVVPFAPGIHHVALNVSVGRTWVANKLAYIHGLSILLYTLNNVAGAP